MKSEDINDLLALCAKAGNAILEIYQNGEAKVKNKKDKSPVTEADICSNNILIEGLKGIFPGIPVISEENTIPSYQIRKQWDLCWIIDPLDGTREFIHKTGEFTINIALVKKQEVVAGFVHVPVEFSTYYAIKNKGSFRFYKGKNQPLKSLSSLEENEYTRITVSRFHPDEKTKSYIDSLKNTNLIAVGSSLKLIYLALGKADIYPRLTSLSEWDIAAPHIILEEAGGSVRTFFGHKKLKYNKQKLSVPPFIASAKSGSR